MPGSHLNILNAAVPVDGRAARPAEYVLCVLGCILASIVFYLLLERPARMKWRQASQRTSHGGAIADINPALQGSEREPTSKAV